MVPENPSVISRRAMEFELQGDERVSHAVIRGVGVVENTRLDDLPPLYETLDPDALDTIVSSDAGVSAFTGTISFPYSNSVVVVQCRSPVRISITPSRDGEWK
jgi:hypothetical protein